MLWMSTAPLVVSTRARAMSPWVTRVRSPAPLEVPVVVRLCPSACVRPPEVTAICALSTCCEPASVSEPALTSISRAPLAVTSPSVTSRSDCRAISPSLAVTSRISAISRARPPCVPLPTDVPDRVNAAFSPRPITLAPGADVPSIIASSERISTRPSNVCTVPRVIGPCATIETASSAESSAVSSIFSAPSVTVTSSACARTVPATARSPPVTCISSAPPCTKAE